MLNSLIRVLKKSIPSIITILNLLSGCLAILLSFNDIALAGLMIFLAGIFDFFDGLAARILDAYSDFGKELDSLADIVSFGVAPSFLLFHMIRLSVLDKNPLFGFEIISASETALLACSFLPAVFAAIRLARFNLIEGRKDVFMGLPSPASGIFIASAGYILFTTDSLWLSELLLNTRFLAGMSISLSMLMVLPIPMFNLKFNNLSFTGNGIRYIFLLPSLMMIVYIGLASIPVIILYYVLLSVIRALIPKTGSSV